jgi:hypothetical protein
MTIASHPAQMPNPITTTDDDGIDLLSIFDFLLQHWKQLAMGAGGGLVVAVLGWFALVNYQAQVVLVNQGAISFVGWKSYTQSLPLLAGQLVQSKQVKPDEVNQIQRMVQNQWWTQNVKPTLMLSKSDTKDLASVSKAMTESGSDNIVNFVVSATASSKDRAEQDVAIATRFMQQGVAYLTLQNMVSSYESQVLNTESELRKRITEVRIELKFLQERAKNLESLQRRFPGNSAVGSQQVVDLADSNAKFMPISTQLVAVQSDINANEEQLTRMQDQLARIKVTSDFVTPALPLVAKEFNGLALVDQLLKIEADLRKTAPADDSNAQQAFNTIQAQLISTKTFFSKGLESRLAPSVRKTFGVIPAAAIGLFLGLLLALAWAVWPLLMQRRTTQPPDTAGSAVTPVATTRPYLACTPHAMQGPSPLQTMDPGSSPGRQKIACTPHAMRGPSPCKPWIPDQVRDDKK